MWNGKGSKAKKRILQIYGYISISLLTIAGGIVGYVTGESPLLLVIGGIIIISGILQARYLGYIGVVLLTVGGGIVGFTLSIGWIGVILGSIIGAGVGIIISR